MLMNDQHYVREAKERVQKAYIDPHKSPTFKNRITNLELAQLQQEYEQIIKIIRQFVHQLFSWLPDVPLLVVVSDNRGYLIDMFGDTLIHSTVEKLGIRVGVLFHEHECGVNVISLALKENQPIRLIGEDHHHVFLHSTACYGVPVHDMSTNQMLGTVSIMTGVAEATDYILVMLVTAVSSIEREYMLIKQNARLHILNEIMVRATPNGILIADENGYIQELNEFAKRLLRLQFCDTIGIQSTELPFIGDYFKEVIQSECRYEGVEIETTHAEDEIPTVIVLDATPILDEFGTRMIGIFAQFRDITERRYHDEFLLQAEKLSLAGQLAAAVAHEIRNPLTSVKGLFQLMYERREFRKDYYEIIHSELQQVESTISEFLGSTQIKETVLTPCDLVEVIESCITLIRPSANMKGIDVQPLLHGVIWVNGDSAKLKKVFLNLLKNALDAMHNPGLIVVNSAQLSDIHKVCIRIIDRGCGISKEMISKLGTPFLTTKDEGTGLGLTISLTILHEHSGTLKFDSKLGEGTTAYVTLPLIHQDKREKL